MGCIYILFYILENGEIWVARVGEQDFLQGVKINKHVLYCDDISNDFGVCGDRLES